MDVLIAFIFLINKLELCCFKLLVDRVSKIVDLAIYLEQKIAANELLAIEHLIDFACLNLLGIEDTKLIREWTALRK